MSNHLVIPYKRTTIPLIRSSVQAYLHSSQFDTHPDTFEWDITQWEQLRSDVSNINVHVSAIDDILKYHAQLIVILSKFPVDIGLEFSYHNAFQPNSSPVSLSNIAYERVCLLFNLAALLSHLADGEDRSNAEGIKRATAYYQNAAGTFSYLLETALPPFVASMPSAPPCPDLTQPIIKAMQSMMLAQAQECYWQKAVMDNYRNGTIARLSKQVALYYAAALESIQSAPASTTKSIPSNWLPHLRVKLHHFEAASQFRKSMEDSENSRYGLELARLHHARTLARKGLECRERGVAETVIQDISTLARYLDDQISKSERDNDLIYHQDVPAPSNLDPIEPASLVKSAILGGLKELGDVLPAEQALFNELTSWGARAAIDIYNDRKSNYISELRDISGTYDLTASSALQELNLPMALDILDRPIEVPSTLLARSQEVRTNDGPNMIRGLIEDVQKLAANDRILLNQAYDFLDGEADDDEKHRKIWGSELKRLTSQQANGDYLDRAKTYSDILEQGQATDQLVREKWAEWEEEVENLALDEASLNSLIPGGQSKTRSHHSVQTQTYARSLRRLLEELEEIRRTRQQSLNRAHNIAVGDDIGPRIKHAAAGISRWREIKPELFEDDMEQEMQKYERFKIDIEKLGQRQEVLLREIEEQNQLLQQARREDPTIKAREKVIRNLDTAYHKYQEILRNLNEGREFYNGLTIRLHELRDACKDWSIIRRDELNTMIRSLEAMKLEANKRKSPQATPTEDAPTLSPPNSYSTPSSPTPQSPSGQTNQSSNTIPTLMDLPPPDSDLWEALPMPITASSPPSHRFGAASTSPTVPTQPITISGGVKNKGKTSNGSASISPPGGGLPPPIKPTKPKRVSVDRQVF